MTVGDLDAAERSRVPRDHFDEPDKSCYAGYGCTDDCPVGGRGRQVPVRPFLHWPDVEQETHAEGPPAPETRQALPKARLLSPWPRRARAYVRHVLFVLFVIAWVYLILYAEWTVAVAVFRLVKGLLT